MSGRITEPGQAPLRGTAMIELELGVIILLLLWIILRLGPRYRTTIFRQDLFVQLRRIEAQVRNVPAEVVEKEWSGWCVDMDAARAGRLWTQKFWDAICGR